MDYEDLLYLDVDFLSEKYETETGEAPKTVISRSEGLNAEAGISFLKSGLNSQITKQFSSSNQAMFKAIIRSIKEYPEFSVDLQPGLKPVTAWIEGQLTIGHWESKKHLEKHLNVFFEIKNNEISYSLILKKEYFFSNVETLEIISPALQRFIQIPVRALCKVLYPLPDIQTFVASPYVICAR